MIEKSIERPLLIGNFTNGGGEMAWAWWMRHHSKLAIVGSAELSPRKKFVKKVANCIHSRDQDAVYWITTNKEKLGVLNVDNSINWVEEFSDPPEEYTDREAFIKTRQFFSTTYFNLLAKSMGIKRSELMPLSSYKRSLEGPLMGYKRVVDSQPDEDKYKEVLMKHMNHLSEVPWFKTAEGKKFFIQDSNNLYITTMSLISAIWSFWSLTCKADAPQQMILIVELPKELLQYDGESEIHSIIVEALEILSRVSSLTTTSLIISTEMLYPVMMQELDIRFKLILQTRDSDIDLSSTENREMISPLLNEQWDAGNQNTGYWIDSYTNENIVVTLKDKDIDFWDDYLASIIE
ncbi:hypothetical protein [Paenibacillus sp. FSL L8-0709]|uniref:hypothetical protein n=1 Tax=Paenibacillus sp. FSL L8-0709 TaxID=2975312 RepID=UPI0030F6ADD6